LNAAAGWRRALAVAGLVVALDQITKEIALDRLAGRAPVELPLGFDLDHVTNTGVAFGLLSDGEGLVIAVTAGALALLLAWFATAPTRPGFWLAIGLLAGGALGNLADRVRVDAVTDFVDPPYWPAFNLSDVAITLGVVMLLAVHWDWARRSP
jgi:signal peptidase II